MYDSTIQPYTYVALRLPSDTIKVQRVVPHTTISLGKYGSFPANHILGRPYHLMFEILDKPVNENGHILRIVSAEELHTESLMLDGSGPGDEADDLGGTLAAAAVVAETETETAAKTGTEIETQTETGTGATAEKTGENDAEGASNDGGRDRPNQTAETETARERDAATTAQSMTMAEIEKLKKGATRAGQDIIVQLLKSHSALSKKTAFSLAKYKLRKRKKYLRRFSVLPLDVPCLTEWMLEQKDPNRIMGVNNEMLGLIGCWGNVHNGGDMFSELDLPDLHPSGRWLIVDDTGGLVVAAMAERMGILYPETYEDDDADTEADPSAPDSTNSQEHVRPMSATNSTITVLHPHLQPNLSMLKYFGYSSPDPSEKHPLYTHLKTLSFLQLMSPQNDSLYANEPETVPEEVLYTYRSNKRTTYERKHHRWKRISAVVDETRAGGFDGCIIASVMEPESILRHVVPLLSGSAPVVVYSPHLEMLSRLSDLYSTARRTSYLALQRGEHVPGTSFEDFPIDPTQLFSATVQTSRARAFQVLPGRTHPVMGSRGGAVGYVFHAVRALRADQPVTARGQTQGRKKRKFAPAGEEKQIDEETKADGDKTWSDEVSAAAAAAAQT